MSAAAGTHRGDDVSAAGTPIPPNWKRIIVAVWGGQAISLLTSATAGFALVWYLTETTGSALILALSSILYFIPPALLGPFAGTVVDRYNRKLVMILADLGVALVTVLIALLFIFNLTSIPLVLVMLFIRSLGSTFHQPAMQAATPLLVPDRHLVRIASLNQGLMGISTIAGPALGILVYTSFGLQAVLFADAVGALIAIGVLLAVTIPDIHLKKEQRTGVLSEVADGFRAVRACPGLLPLFVIVTVGCMCYMSVSSLFPLMTYGHFGGDGFDAALVEAVFGGGYVLGSLILGIWGGGRRLVPVIGISTILQALTFAASGLLASDAFVPFVVLAGVGAVAGAFFNGPLTALIQRRIEPEKLGRVMTLLISVMSLASPLGLLIAGPVAEQIGVPGWFVISGTTLAATLLMVFFVPSVRSLDKPQSAS